MDPLQTGKHYDQLAAWWQNNPNITDYGMHQLERCISFVEHRGDSLDVGCGSHPRFFSHLLAAGFKPEGMDVSEKMLELARRAFPDCTYYYGDIAEWTLPKKYDLITAWDSTFHLPLALQEPALKNLCGGLKPGGVLMFTCGGTEAPGEISGTMEGLRFDYSALGITHYLEILLREKCEILHLEYDQGADGRHVCMMARKKTEVPDDESML